MPTLSRLRQHIEVDGKSVRHKAASGRRQAEVEDVFTAVHVDRLP